MRNRVRHYTCILCASNPAMHRETILAKTRQWQWISVCRQQGATWLWIAFCETWKEATSLWCQGQTRLISLQWPLKFLPSDINEVIHRKAAALHIPPPPPVSYFPFPMPPCCTATVPEKGSSVPAWELSLFPLRLWQLQSMDFLLKHMPQWGLYCIYFCC